VSVQKTDEVDWKDEFVRYMCKLCPSLECLVYNETETTARPTKEDPQHLLYGRTYVTETTPPPTNLTYQLSPDTFCEINHEVERLQYDQAKEWLLRYCSPNDAKTQTLLVSGRDVSSFGLGFGALEDDRKRRLFQDVVAVQHCGLVHADAVANFERHADNVNATAYHKTKQEMGKAICNHLSDTATTRNNGDQQNVLVGVMTGGRKGLDPNYVEYLVGAHDLQVIIYNSCNTKSLVRDMQSLHPAFDIEDFRSYNFFPGTKYTASLTLLIRRLPKTLILPVGPAGVGKSCLAESLIHGGMALKCWQRDIVFSKLRAEGVGLNKTKSQVHQDLLSFLSSNSGLLYVDSTNGNEEARRLYLKEAKADRVVYLNFHLLQGTKEEQFEWLMNRTQNRLGDNSDQHPAFPDTLEDQRKKHANILKGISYPTTIDDEVSTSKTSTLLLPCHPEEDIEHRSFAVFVGITCSKFLKEFVL